MARLGRPATADARRWPTRSSADFAYEGDATCAGDSMCPTSCPVKIDTGALMKELRAAAHRAARAAAAALAARHFGARPAAGPRAGCVAARAAARAAAGRRASSTLVTAVGCTASRRPSCPRLPSGAGAAARRAAPARVRPRARAARPSSTSRAASRACSARCRARRRAAADAARAAARAGFAVASRRRPDGALLRHAVREQGLSGRGRAPRRRARRSALARLATAAGSPVVTDASPCAGTLAGAARRATCADGALRVLDFPSFWAREVLPRPSDRRAAAGTAVLHPTCTLVKAAACPTCCASRAPAPRAWWCPRRAECCGFAGDKGFLVPGADGERDARRGGGGARPAGRTGAGLYSTCRTCEIGMTRAVGRPYRSLVQLVREAMTGA